MTNLQYLAPIVKIQRKVSLIFRTDFMFALISRHFISLSRYFRLWKVMPQIKEPVSNEFKKYFFLQESEIFTWIFHQNTRNCKKSMSWIFNSIWLNLFNTCSFIWGITFHNLKYLDKLIKCLERRANIKSVRKIIESFLCIFTYI